MTLSRLIPVAMILTLTACQSVPKPRVAKLTASPDTAQIQTIETAVKSAMGRTDLDMDPGRLNITPILIVRPVVTEGLVDQVPGRPTRFTLMTLDSSCFLLEAGGGRQIELPDVTCR